MTTLQKILGTLAVLAIHGGAGAAGQVVPGGAMPEALKGMRQASAVCRASEPGTGSGHGPSVRADLGCAVGADAAQAMLQRPDSVTIDLRQGADFASFHIGGALNASISDLHSKPYWRGKPVLLVGSGKAERELYMECTRLKQLGYKDVKVLRGGMPSWLAANQPVMGRAPVAGHLARLSPSELWLESENPDNMVVLGKGQEALRKEIPSAVVLAQLTAQAVRAAIDKRRVGKKNAPLASVVVVADAATPAQQFEALQQAVLPVPVLLYTDSRDAFARHLVVQKAVWVAQERGPKQPACGQ